MAKTIKEMTIEAADIFGGDNYDRSIYTDGYTDGTNAVLAELDKAIKECNVDGSPYVAILDRIRQLKGGIFVSECCDTMAACDLPSSTSIRANWC